MTKETWEHRIARLHIKPDRDVAVECMEENRRLRDLLDSHGRHYDWCAEWPEMKQKCDCGFAERLNEVLAR